ncbi:hypothetical protein K469DRAFT_692027 [Zopfia rhizophila CBS 207.26]|uniref:Methyltransferase n=1 Tax=Zopfia rhizophila CBS 207.26 TaxID=1314779 RepID=A0A6A6DUA0_9PEZI|nr:hypothetical protein K469DRAFT_692027 [Zopfia rhizophila CBS 207.26]
MLDNLQYLCDLPVYKSEQPYELYGFPEKQSTTHTNCEFESKPVSVTDVRNVSTALETHGFMYLRHVSECELDAKHFETVGGDQSVVESYLCETIELVRGVFEAVDVVCFDWRFRRRDPTASGKIPPRELKDIRNYALPTGDIVHCDYSASGGYDRIRMQLLPEELESVTRNNYKMSIVNVWRPLNKIVKNTPLLFCHKRSVRKDDLIEVDKVLQDKVEKSYFLFHRDYHKWFYLADQRSDEVAIFPTWVSESTGDFAGCCPHGAGASETDGWKDPRQSVEVRLIVIQQNVPT